MKRYSLRKLLTLSLAMAVVIGVSTTQHAHALSIRLNSGTVIDDDSPGDGDVSPFIYGERISGVLVVGEGTATSFRSLSEGTSAPEIGALTGSELHFTVKVTSKGAGGMTVAVTDEYDPLSASFTGLIASVGGSVSPDHSVVVKVYLGTSAFDTTGTLIGEFTGGHPITPFDLVVGASDPLLASTYYLTIEETFTFASAGHTSSIDVSVVPTPEPASLILMGSGLVGLGLWGRSRSKKS